MQRVWALTAYLVRSLFFSLTGLIYTILALVYWILFFDPRQGTPHVDNYILMIAAFGTGMTFLVTLSIASRANQAEHFPLVVRLPSRVEYLTAVMLSSILSAFLLQILLGLLALYHGPSVGTWLAALPPIWVALNILASVMALHASDFVTKEWSRVYLYGLLAILLFMQGMTKSMYDWLSARLFNVSYSFNGAGFEMLGNFFSNVANWVLMQGNDANGGFFSFIFWPFRALTEAVINGYFEPAQALAPAILLLYATILFLLAADLFATKDLEFIE